MMARRAHELSLAADFSCSGTFCAVGSMCEPGFALSVAVRDLLHYRDNSELQPVVVHVLATRLAGRCKVERARTQRALGDCMAASVALEWRITIPNAGIISALFLVTRFDPTGERGLFDLALQLASKPSFAANEAEEAEPPRRASCLLRIF